MEMDSSGSPTDSTFRKYPETDTYNPDQCPRHLVQRLGQWSLVGLPSYALIPASQHQSPRLTRKSSHVLSQLTSES